MAGGPTRVMMCMLATTYALSLTMSPTRLIAEPAGPIRYGIAHIVRPRMPLRNSAPAFVLPSAGAIQLLVGPPSPHPPHPLHLTPPPPPPPRARLPRRYHPA